MSPENTAKITQFSRSGTAIIGHQGFMASKMAIDSLKLRYSNTTTFVLGKHVNFLIICKFISSHFATYYGAPSPSEIDAFHTCAEKRHTILVGTH